MRAFRIGRSYQEGIDLEAKGKTMAKGQKRSSKEIRKPKAETKKTNASNPSTKGLISDVKR